MHLSEAVFKHTRIVYFLLLAVFVGGIFSYLKLSKLEDPEIEIIAANVITVYPGASAHEVELKVTKVLEDELAALSDIRKVESRSEANVSVIAVTLEMTVPQKEVQQRWEFLRRKLELAVPRLPAGTQTPIVIDDFNDVYGMFYGMTADEGFSYQDMNAYADYLRYNLLEVEGVKRVAVYGRQKPQITIGITGDKMSRLGVLSVQILNAINQQSAQTYSGNFRSGDEQLRIQVDQQATSEEDLRQILLTSLTGESFKLGDIASIERGYEAPLRNTLFVDNQ